MTLIMVHGWLSLWSTWSYQIQELRGFGTPNNFVGDLQRILKDAEVESGICIGHNWGSAGCYEAARSRPDMFSGVYIFSAGAYVPIKLLTAAIPKLTYQLCFGRKTSEAAEELDKDTRSSVHVTLCYASGQGQPSSRWLLDTAMADEPVAATEATAEAAVETTALAEEAKEEKVRSF
ncbi:hypothetical protein EV360DRAFT_76192 [Lentinula raphanica]|nr:hypothetical protein EV360DRAFT_76192 [Lentinula raphanica]